MTHLCGVRLLEFIYKLICRCPLFEPLDLDCHSFNCNRSQIAETDTALPVRNQNIRLSGGLKYPGITHAYQKKRKSIFTYVRNKRPHREWQIKLDSPEPSENILLRIPFPIARTNRSLKRALNAVRLSCILQEDPRRAIHYSTPNATSWRYLHWKHDPLKRHNSDGGQHLRQPRSVEDKHTVNIVCPVNNNSQAGDTQNAE